AWLDEVAALKDDQLESLSRLATDTGLPPEFSSIDSARYALRLYARLTPEQREVLSRGHAIPVGQMFAPQRELFLAPLQERGRAQAAALRPEQLAGGSLSATHYEFVRVREQRGDSTRYRWDPPPAQAPATPGSTAPRAGGATSRPAPRALGADSHAAAPPSTAGPGPRPPGLSGEE